MESILDSLTYNTIAFGIELVLLLLISVVGFGITLRFIRRILSVPALKMSAESQDTWIGRLRRSNRTIVGSIILLLLLGNLVLSFLDINTVSTTRDYATQYVQTYLERHDDGIASDQNQYLLFLRLILPHIALGSLKLVGIHVAAIFLGVILKRGIRAGHKRLQQVAWLQEELPTIQELLERLSILIKYTLFMLALFLSALVVGVPALWLLRIRFLVYGVIAFYAARLIVGVAHLTLETLFRFSDFFTNFENPLKYLGSLQHLLPLTKRSVEYFVYVGAATWVAREIDPSIWIARFGNIAIRIIAIFFISRVLIEVCTLFLYEFFIDRAEEEEQVTRASQQRQTLAPLMASMLRYGIYFAAMMMVLKEAGINPTPLLAGAGILGVAAGLGAQTLVTDIVSGFFILFENLFLVGDFIECAGVEGFVAEIGIRVTRIRDRSGVLHSVPNGEIRKIASHSDQYVNAIVDVGIAYEADLEKATRVLGELGVAMHEEHPDVLEPTVVVGVMDFGESEILIRTRTRVSPAKDFDVSNLLRRRIKQAFDRESIEIPYARRVLIFKNDKGKTPTEASPEPSNG